MVLERQIETFETYLVSFNFWISYRHISKQQKFFLYTVRIYESLSITLKSTENCMLHLTFKIVKISSFSIPFILKTITTLRNKRYSHPMASSSSVAIIEDESNQAQYNTNITESPPTRISNPSLVTPQGTKRHCCYFFIFFIPIAITVVSLVLYNFASLKNFIR